MSRLQLPRWTGCRLPHKVKHNLRGRRATPTPPPAPPQLPTPPPPNARLCSPSPSENTRTAPAPPSPHVETRRIRPRLAISAGKPGLANHPYSLAHLRRHEDVHQRSDKNVAKLKRTSPRSARPRRISEAAQGAVTTRTNPAPHSQKRHVGVQTTSSPRRSRSAIGLGHSPVKTYALRTKITPTEYASDAVRHSFEGRKRLAGAYQLRQHLTPSPRASFDACKARRDNTWAEYRRLLDA
ncbi:hypothetical protein CC1G_03484 [Coprinopsis cinerea okayama7|uniref:Uncharacterized protein n=1 Tax=Coprinopsis cinerea (strain Okayama-7 / 130 / ATCC MYA-4618 / FGSC 9003) TaxID=240176 RepID=A8NCC6_COPC7|nr:hypothetical protein CC1G_03484 [Coprinopsis cinerea okayama7\|eukprot:XP_001832470.1 hypothetical protein CC1G_03484 [Coprinopsis cinerea okayama7\